MLRVKVNKASVEVNKFVVCFLMRKNKVIYKKIFVDGSSYYKTQLLNSDL